MKTAKKLIVILALVPFAIVPASCEKADCPCAEGPQVWFDDVLQLAKLVKASDPEDTWSQQSEWGISEIENKKLELIAVSKAGVPLVDENRTTVRQIAEKVEAKFEGLHWMKLYMQSQGKSNGGTGLEDSFFILKIDNGLWFNIRATHYWGTCKAIRLKSFVFEEGKRYATEFGETAYIPIDEKKKREELKQAFPDGFPYKL